MSKRVIIVLNGVWNKLTKVSKNQKSKNYELVLLLQWISMGVPEGPKKSIHLDLTCCCPILVAMAIPHEHKMLSI